MPHADLHKKKFKKNLAVFLMVIGFMGLIWAVTIIRIGINVHAREAVKAAGQEAPPPSPSSVPQP